MKYLLFALLLFMASACVSVRQNVDLNYKLSTDKRLLIELNLMKMCKLNNPFPQVEITAQPEVKKKTEVTSHTSQKVVNKPIIENKEVLKPTPEPISTIANTPKDKIKNMEFRF